MNYSFLKSVLPALITLVTAMSSTLNFLSHTDEFCREETRVRGYEKIKSNYFSDTLEQSSFPDIVKKIQPFNFIPLLVFF